APSRVAVSTRHRLSPNECRSGCCGPPPSRASGVPPGTPHEQVGKIGRRVLTTQAQGNAKKNGSGSGNKNLLHSRRAWIMCGRRRLGKNFLSCCSIGRVRSCVRPVLCGGEAAGHNALRGSGPNQKHAFKDALTQTGSPDPGSTLSALRRHVLANSFKL